MNVTLGAYSMQSFAFSRATRFLINQFEVKHENKALFTMAFRWVRFHNVRPFPEIGASPYDAQADDGDLHIIPGVTAYRINVATGWSG